MRFKNSTSKLKTLFIFLKNNFKVNIIDYKLKYQLKLFWT